MVTYVLNIGLEACQGNTKDVQKLHKNKGLMK